jgi:hypothetical protein
MSELKNENKKLPKDNWINESPKTRRANALKWLAIAKELDATKKANRNLNKQ